MKSQTDKSKITMAKISNLVFNLWFADYNLEILATCYSLLLRKEDEEGF